MMRTAAAADTLWQRWLSIHARDYRCCPSSSCITHPILLPVSHSTSRIALSFLSYIGISHLFLSDRGSETAAGASASAVHACTLLDVSATHNPQNPHTAFAHHIHIDSRLISLYSIDFKSIVLILWCVSMSGGGSCCGGGCPR
jgi:hypothetical protein